MENILETLYIGDVIEILVKMINAKILQNMMYSIFALIIQFR